MELAGIMGFAFMTGMTICLLKTTWQPGILFVVFPVAAGILSGFSWREMGAYGAAGVRTVAPLALMFLGAVLFFGLLNETGLFSYLVFVIKEKAADTRRGIFLMTVFLATAAHLSGSGVVSYLIVINGCSSLYKQKKIPLKRLMCLASLTFGVMNMTPWAGPCGRLAGALKTDPVKIWQKCIPSQIFGLCLLCLIACILAKKDKGEEEKTDLEAREKPMERPRGFFRNLSLMAAAVVALAVGAAEPAVIFMTGTGILLAVDFKEKGRELLKKYLKQSKSMLLTVLASGVLVGMVVYSPMLEEMTFLVSCMLPKELAAHAHILLGLICNPASWVLSGEAEIFGLVPIGAELAAAAGVSPEAAGAAFLIPYSAVIFVLPTTVSVHAGLSLCQVELREHIKTTYPWTLLCSLGMLAFALCLGAIPL